MIELKTLKDFGSFKCGADNYLCDKISKEDLKAEAVKWVKQKTFISKDYQNGKVDFIIDFFNLTKEDLQ